MGKQVGQSVNSATPPPAPAIGPARTSSRSNPRAPRTIVAPFACHVRSRGAFPFYALLRGLAYSSARAGDDDDLVLDSLHKVLLSTSDFLLSTFTFDIPAVSLSGHERPISDSASGMKTSRLRRRERSDGFFAHQLFHNPASALRN